MRILHTGDWHLGKHLEGVSRLDEQELFLKDFVELVKSEEIDIVLIAGDIYDAFNPPSRAETLFYRSLKEMSASGERLIVVIPGNHDNPQRLVSARPLARDHGIIMVDSLKTLVETGPYGQHTLIASGEGYIEVKVRDERAVILTVPYPSEKRLEAVFLDDDETLATYSDKIKSLFDQVGKAFREDTINIVMTHLFTMGAEETGSERSIQLGGSYIVDSSCFPEQAQYVALGHIHKPMLVPKTHGKCRYAGSPLQYNKKERNYEKGCYILDISPQEMSVDFKPFKVYKPIEVWDLPSIDEALAFCETKQDENSYVYMNIETDRYIQEHEIKAMRRLKKDILEITPILDHMETANLHDYREEPIEKLFEAFYMKSREVAPSDEIKALFMSIVGGEDETH